MREKFAIFTKEKTLFRAKQMETYLPPQVELLEVLVERGMDTSATAPSWEPEEGEWQ